MIAILFYHAPTISFVLIDGSNVCVRGVLINHSSQFITSHQELNTFCFDVTLTLIAYIRFLRLWV